MAFVQNVYLDIHYMEEFAFIAINHVKHVLEIQVPTARHAMVAVLSIMLINHVYAHLLHLHKIQMLNM
jgi:hypothetical protein